MEYFESKESHHTEKRRLYTIAYEIRQKNGDYAVNG
jgi:hypothetical protein